MNNARISGIQVKSVTLNKVLSNFGLIVKFVRYADRCNIFVNKIVLKRNNIDH